MIKDTLFIPFEIEYNQCANPNCGMRFVLMAIVAGQWFVQVAPSCPYCKMSIPVLEESPATESR